MPSKDELFETGFRLFKANDFEGAIVALKEALEQNRDDTETLRTLAMAHYRLEQYAEALPIGHRLVELAPKDPLSFTTLSLFLQKNGEIAAAEEASAKAKVLTWKRELREGSGIGDGFQILDTNPMPTISEPMLPQMPSPPAAKPTPAAAKPTPAAAKPTPPKDEPSPE